MEDPQARVYGDTYQPKEKKPERKMIATDTETGKLFEKIAKAMTKQPDQHGTVFVKDAVRAAGIDYVKNHPELGVKA